jgi:hypothetical protein
LPKSNYEYNKKWRLRNPDKRNKGKKINYSKTRKNAKNTGRPWGDHEVRRIFSTDRPSDRELSVELGRSVQAIQVKRSKTIPSHYT